MFSNFNLSFTLAPTSNPVSLTLINKTLTSISISWAIPDGGRSDADGYTVNASSYSVGSIIKTVFDTTQTTFTGLLPGQTYNITVRAFQDLLGPASDVLSVITLDGQLIHLFAFFGIFLAVFPCSQNGQISLGLKDLQSLTY